MAPPTLEELKQIACTAIDEQASALAEVAQSIWNNPETNYEEVHAHRVLTDLLETNGLSVERQLIVDTAFRATYGSGGCKPNVAVLCEYDALPGIGHACGHNLIAEVGAGAGIGVKVALQHANKHGLQMGKVTVLGTPAEEGGGGKIDLIKAGVFDDVDAALMAHPFNKNYVESDDALFAIQQLEVTYKGKASHAAAFPSEGLNALDAAVLAYNNISVLRQQMKSAWKVHGVITNGGEKPNIIPEETSMSYYLRATTKAELENLKVKMTNCFEAAALATGCKVEYHWVEKPFDNMVSNPVIVDLYRANSKGLDITFTSREELRRLNVCGSTDMGNVSYAVPSIHPMFAIGGDGSQTIHSRDFTGLTGSPEAQPHAIRQAKMLAMTTLDLLHDKQLLNDAKQQFKKQHNLERH